VLNFAGNAPSLAAEINQHKAIGKWLQTIRDMGEGQRSNMAASDALAIAREATPDGTPPADAIDDEALPVGQMIAIKPNDYGQEVTTGEIIWATPEAIAVRRTDAQVGNVLVHYPRLGYLFEDAS
jgi:hypothetical protein